MAIPILNVSDISGPLTPSLERRMWEHVREFPGIQGMRRRADSTFLFGHAYGPGVMASFPVDMFPENQIPKMTGMMVDDEEYKQAEVLFEKRIGLQAFLWRRRDVYVGPQLQRALTVELAQAWLERRDPVFKDILGAYLLGVTTDLGIKVTLDEECRPCFSVDGD